MDRHLAGEGPPSLLFAGEPGIGKSRLLGQARQRATEHGWHVLAGGCLCRAAQEPYAPLLQAVAAHVTARTPAQLRSDLHGCAWLVRLLPELASGPIEPLPRWVLPPEQERRLMVGALQRFVGNLAGPAGTLLVLDDLQWAGADALDLLAALLDAPTTPVRLVGAYRSSEVGPRAALAQTLAGLADRGLVTHRALDPLAPDEVRQLLDGLLEGSEAATQALTERLLQRTGGVPFFVVSCAQAIRQGASEGGLDGVVPWDVAQRIRQRIARLSEPSQVVLGLAARIGRNVQPDLLVAASEHNAGDVLAALDAAAQARLLLDDGRTYRFIHDLIREVVEADVGMARRLLLHRRIAAALEQDTGERTAEALAYHYDHAGLSQPALRYRELAGDHAWAQHANAAAEDHYRRLVERRDQLGRRRDAARYSWWSDDWTRPLMCWSRRPRPAGSWETRRGWQASPPQSGPLACAPAPRPRGRSGCGRSWHNSRRADHLAGWSSYTRRWHISCSRRAVTATTWSQRNGRWSWARSSGTRRAWRGRSGASASPTW